jgi:hypothetical protein
VATTTTGADGKFLFQGIDPGGYQVRAEHAGYSPGAYGADQPGAPALVLTARSGANTDNLRISLALKFDTTLTGAILNDAGAGMRDVQVRLVQVTRPMGHIKLSPRVTVSTDAQGRYNIGSQNVPPGSYYLVASTRMGGAPLRDSAKAGYVTTWYPGVKDLSSAAPVQVGSVGGNQNFDIHMARGVVYSAHGKVTGDVPRGALADMRVVVTAAGDSANPSPLLGFSTLGPGVAANGAFDVTLPGVGSYYLTLTGRSGQIASLGCQRIQVDNGDLHGATIEYQPQRELRGVIRVEPAPAVNLQALRVSLSTNEIITNANSAVAAVQADGSFVFPDLAPGAYRVRVIPPPGLYVKSVFLGSRDFTDEGLELLSGSEPAPLTITLSGAGGSVIGSVSPASPGNRVSIAPDGLAGSASQYSRTTVDETGHFRLDGLPPGRYRVYAWQTANLISIGDSDFLKAYDDKSVRVEVKPNTATAVTLTAIPID